MRKRLGGDASVHLLAAEEALTLARAALASAKNESFCGKSLSHLMRARALEEKISENLEMSREMSHDARWGKLRRDRDAIANEQASVLKRFKLACVRNGEIDQGVPRLTRTSEELPYVNTSRADKFRQIAGLRGARSRPRK